MDLKLAEDDPERFLRELFYDEDGNDEGGPPVVLNNLDAGYRQGLHAAAKRLFHETSITNRMVIGSSKNNLGQQMVREINRAAGWPREPYQPRLNSQHQKRKRADEEDDDDGEDEDQDEDEEHGDDGEPSSDEADEHGGSWDITGTWEIECPRMAGCIGQFSPTP